MLKIYTVYEVKKNEKKVKLARFRLMTFENMDVISDVRDEKTFLITLNKDSLTKQQTEELMKDISKNYGKSEKGEKYIRGDFYR